MTARPTLKLQARAKLNLALAVGPPRIEDGLHPIASWMAPIELADELTICRLEPDRDSRYAILWAGDAPRRTDIDWSITRDLAVRAHLALEAWAGRRLPVQLKLEKRIPVGGGLGGGSSDAAATLLAVRELFDLPISDEELRDIGCALGADVPFFLPPAAAAPALVAGAGEVVERTAAELRGGVVLLAPPMATSTAAVYRAFDDVRLERPFEEAAAQVAELASAGDPAAAELFNDLQTPALTACAELAQLLEAASETAGLPLRLTGSGSCCFAVAPSEDEAQRACAALRSAPELSRCAVLTTRFAAS